MDVEVRRPGIGGGVPSSPLRVSSGEGVGTIEAAVDTWETLRSPDHGGGTMRYWRASVSEGGSRAGAVGREMGFVRITPRLLHTCVVVLRGKGDSVFVTLLVLWSLRIVPSVELGLLTSTQSGSLVGVHGFGGRLVFGTSASTGGLRLDRAGIPPSSHHFLRSELAGGKPGAMES